MFHALGVNPLERKIIAVKLGYLTAMHKKVAARAIMALSSGSSNEILESLPYQKVTRPLYPLDRDIRNSQSELSFLKLIKKELPHSRWSSSLLLSNPFEYQYLILISLLRSVSATA